MKTLIIYSSKNGQTKKIAIAIAAYLVYHCECSIIDIRDAYNHKVESYQRVVIGASIRYGNYAPELKVFIKQQLDWLNSVPSAFYSVNLTARKKNKHTPETNIYTNTFFEKSIWKPDLCDVFAGALRYPCYSLFDRWLIKLVMYITGGETDTNKEIEYTDWKKVLIFAIKLSNLNFKKKVMQC